MKVSVHVVGGVFGDDRLLSVNEDELTVIEEGKLHHSRRLEPQAAEEVRDLARNVAGLELPSGKAKVAVDGGTTTIEIADTTVRRTIVVSAGDDPPEPVWVLLDAVEALDEAPPVSSQ